MILRFFFLALALVAVLVVATFGVRGHHFTKPPFEVFPDMNYQDKVKDQVGSAFFSDGVASRAPIPGTVAEEMPAKIDYWASGKWDATHWGDGIPVHEARDGMPALQIDAANMARGQERLRDRLCRLPRRDRRRQRHHLEIRDERRGQLPHRPGCAALPTAIFSIPSPTARAR